MMWRQQITKSSLFTETNLQKVSNREYFLAMMAETVRTSCKKIIYILPLNVLTV